MRRNIFGLLVLILSCCTSMVTFAEPQGYLKRPDFETLGLYVSVSYCPFTNDELTNKLKGEWLRARLKGYDTFLSRTDGLHLSVTSSCLEAKVGDQLKGYAVKYNINYATKINEQWMLFDDSYGSLLVGGTDAKSYFISSIAESVSKALTVYLESNI